LKTIVYSIPSVEVLRARMQQVCQQIRYTPGILKDNCNYIGSNYTSFMCRINVYSWINYFIYNIIIATIII